MPAEYSKNVVQCVNGWTFLFHDIYPSRTVRGNSDGAVCDEHTYPNLLVCVCV